MKKIFILLIVSFALNYSLQAQNIKAAPDFSVKDIYGNNHKLYDDYLNKGKYVFIDFFSNSCVSCQNLAPMVDTVFREYACNCSDLIFLGINTRVDEGDESVREFTNNFQMSFPAISGKSGGKNIADDFGVAYTPYKILIAPDGSIVFEEPLINSTQDLRDTLQNLNLGFTPAQCEGNDMLYFAVSVDDLTIVGDIDSDNKTVTVDIPFLIDLSSIIATFTSSSNSLTEVGGVEQTSGETVNDFSAGVVTYGITSETGNSQNWDVTITSTSNIIDYNNNLFSVFPNPTTGIVNFNIDFIQDNNLSIFISDIAGKKVDAVIKNNSGIYSADLSKLKNGIYFINVKTDFINITQKILLN